MSNISGKVVVLAGASSGIGEMFLHVRQSSGNPI
jgi:NADP-dependent 3-hydroxy acid dehydrogenase YdfG